MLFKILSTMLRDCIAGLVMAVGMLLYDGGTGFCQSCCLPRPGCVQGQWGEM